MKCFNEVLGHRNPPDTVQCTLSLVLQSLELHLKVHYVNFLKSSSRFFEPAPSHERQVVVELQCELARFDMTSLLCTLYNTINMHNPAHSDSQEWSQVLLFFFIITSPENNSWHKA